MAKDKIAKAFLAITKDKFTIDTIAEMIATKHLAEGDIVRLNGYYSAGDGANHIRKISKTDDGSGVQLANGLWANIVHSGEVNVSWFGAKCDGVADDTSFVQKALDFGGNLKFDKEKCLITSSLKIGENTHIDFNDNSLVYGIGAVSGVYGIRKSSLFQVCGIETEADITTYNGVAGDYFIADSKQFLDNQVFPIGTYEIRVKEPEYFNVGDEIHIGEGLAYWHTAIGEYNKITRKSGNSLFLEKALRNTYSTASNSLGKFVREYLLTSNPSGSGQPTITNFNDCGVRKVELIKNITIKNLNVETLDTPNVTRNFILANISSNIVLENINCDRLRIWVTDSENISIKNSNLFCNDRNHYLANGNYNVIVDNCTFFSPPQIEEGGNNITVTNSRIVNTSSFVNVVGFVQNVTIGNLDLIDNQSTIAFQINKVKGININNMNVISKNLSLSVRNKTFSEAFPNADAYKNNPNITDFFNTRANVDSSYFSNTLETLGAELSLSNVKCKSVISNYIGLVETTSDTQFISKKIKATYGEIDKIYTVLSRGDQFSFDTTGINQRGMYAGTSNGAGTAFQGSQTYGIIGVKNSTSNDILTNNSEYQIIKPNLPDGRVYFRTMQGIGFIQTGVTALDTPYHASNMSRLGILDKYHNYLSELHEYENSQNVPEGTMNLNVVNPPVIPKEIEDYAKEYNLG